MKTTHLPGRACPTCGDANTGAADVLGDAAPEPGDYSVCITCGSVATYDAALQLVAVPPGAGLPPGVARHVRAWQAMQRRRRVH